jgi:CheY-like chemotaxis protein
MADAPQFRLLVVDDEPDIVELLSASLRFAGYEAPAARRPSSSPRPSAPTWCCST